MELPPRSEYFRIFQGQKESLHPHGQGRRLVRGTTLICPAKPNISVTLNAGFHTSRSSRATPTAEGSPTKRPSARLAPRGLHPPPLALVGRNALFFVRANQYCLVILSRKQRLSTDAPSIFRILRDPSPDTQRSEDSLIVALIDVDTDPGARDLISTVRPLLDPADRIEVQQYRSGADDIDN